MIRLTKQPEPQVLIEHSEEWTNEYLEAVASGDGIPDVIKYRYRHPQIKATLRVETAAKCAYCESKIAPVAPEHIEHILAKSHRPELIVEWTNLTLACPECNSRKGEYYSVVEPLINPYEDDPGEHLLFLGPLVFGLTDKGERTSLRLDLSRAGLVERKVTRLKAIHNLVGRSRAEGNPELRALLEEQVLEEARRSVEYSAVVEHYIRSAGLDVPDGDPASPAEAG